MKWYCGNEPENIENIVWIAESNTGDVGEVTYQWIMIYDNDKIIWKHFVKFGVL